VKSVHIFSLAFLLLAVCAVTLGAAEPAATQPQAAAPSRIDIFEYKVLGVTKLTAEEVEATVYPLLGEARTPEDVEGARVALEKLYQKRGYQTVSVVVPQQRVADATVVIQVVEGKVGRLRIHGSRYFDHNTIKEKVPSVAEGEVPDFNAFTREMVGLNQSADCRVTPSLRAGVVPGTVDVDLNVEDHSPLHGSLELNNRYSANTTQTRLNGALSYSNLWQLGHTIGGSFQVAPENPDDAKVYSGYYMMPIPDTPVKMLLQGTKQDSDVSTLGAFDVAGRGETVGLQAIVALPSTETYVHSFTVGMDYKHYEELLSLTGTSATTQTPITYFPIALGYSGSLIEKRVMTQVNGSVNFSARGMGSSTEEFDNKRFNSTGSYIYFRGDLSQTRDVIDDVQLFGKVQGQVSSGPLISSEEFGAGGLSTVRGYLESAAMGDNAVVGTFEVRTPPFTLAGYVDEWRAYVFTDWAYLTVMDTLAEQTSSYCLGSVGVGSLLKFHKHFNGTIDLGFPLQSEGDTEQYHPRLTFRVWAEF